MYWNLRGYLKSKDIWPTTKRLLITYLEEQGVPDDWVVQLRALEVEEDEEFSSIDEMWDGCPDIKDYYFNQDE